MGPLHSLIPSLSSIHQPTNTVSFPAILGIDDSSTQCHLTGRTGKAESDHREGHLQSPATRVGCQ